LRADHPFVGRWVHAEGDSEVEYQIAAAPGGFIVAAKDAHDGEELEVFGTHWDGDALHFNVRVPSNGYRTEHVVRLLPDGSIDDVFTAHHHCVLKRHEPPSGS
jgi:hypothetical protein